MSSMILVIALGSLIASVTAIFAVAAVIMHMKATKSEIMRAVCCVKKTQEQYNGEVAQTVLRVKELLDNLTSFDVEEMKRAIMQAVQERVDRKIRDIAN